MNNNEVYEKLSIQGANNYGDSVKVRDGIFTEEDLITLMSGNSELYFKIDKQGLFDIINIILSKISQLPQKDTFIHMVDIFYLLQNEINNYYGTSRQENRISFYMRNGQKTDDEDVRICSMSQIKGIGIAKCAEKAALANNILLMLNSMGLFDYKVKYLNAITTLNNGIPEGHAFLEFDRIDTKGKIIHIIYDVTNPEIVLLNGEEYFYPAIYSLSDDEYKSFMEGNSFDNSKFIMANYFQQKENRTYRGFSKTSNYNDDFEKIKRKI